MLKLSLIIIYSFKFYKISILFLKLKKCELKNLIKSIQKPIKKSNYKRYVYILFWGLDTVPGFVIWTFALYLKMFNLTL